MKRDYETAARAVYPENKAHRIDEVEQARQASRFARTDQERAELLREGKIRSAEKTRAQLHDADESAGARCSSGRHIRVRSGDAARALTQGAQSHAIVHVDDGSLCDCAPAA